MRTGMVLVLLLWVATSTNARADDSVERAHKRIMDDALTQALEASKTLPQVSERDFVKWWRPAIAEMSKSLCACQFADTDCARLAFDEFTIDLMGLAFRLKGVRDAFLAAKDSDEAGKLGEEITTGILRRQVPAKEQLRVQARLKECVNHAIGKRYRASEP